MKLAILLLLTLPAFSQGGGRREVSRLWLRGKFSEAEQQFAQNRPFRFSFYYAWEADFEIERARFGIAAALIKEARGLVTSGEELVPERCWARLLLSTGRFADAEKLIARRHRWDGRDIRKLKSESAMDLVTLGEIFLYKGRYPEAIAIFEKAAKHAKKPSTYEGFDWLRAQLGIAMSNLEQGSLQAASATASNAVAAAERQWGTASIPAMDARDVLGLIRLSESRFQEADEAFSRSRNWRVSLYGQDHPKVAASYLHAALLCLAQDDKQKAERLAIQALEIERALADGPNGRWALALLTAAEIFRKAGKVSEGKDCYDAAIPVLEAELGSDAPRLESARNSRLLP